ncbi:MAG: cell division protein FtsZ [Bacteroidota bacterium]
MIHFDLPKEQSSIIKVIGVGGGGSNAVNHMFAQNIEGVNFIICNTDAQAIALSKVPNKIQLGPHLTQGLGAGANPSIGRQATEESLEEIKRILEVNTKMAFITAGMGGGTGTGGAPIIAQICKELGILTVGIVTTPFAYEGKKRLVQAEAGINLLKEHVDTLLVISNDKLRHQFGNLKMKEAFGRADNVLATAAKCITDVINSTGQINVDFADVCTVMSNGGVAILGSASASGENRAQTAIENALTSPLLNDSEIKGAKWILININSAEGEHEFTMDEVEVIQNYLLSQAGEETDVILGLGYDNSLGSDIGITLIATGFNHKDPFAKETKQESIEDSDKVVLHLDLPKATPVSIPVTKEIVIEDIVEEKILTALVLENETNKPTFSQDMPVTETPSDLMAITIKEEVVVEEKTEWIEVKKEAEKIFFEISSAADQIPTTKLYMSSEVTPTVKVAPAVIKAVVEEKIQPAVQPETEKSSSLNSGGYLAKPAQIYAEQKPADQEIQKPEETIQVKRVVEEEPVIELQLIVKDLPKVEEEQPIAQQTQPVNNPVSEENEIPDETEALRRRANERLAKLRNLSFNVNTADPNNEFETVPAYLRRNMEMQVQLTDAESFYSNYTVKPTENNQAEIGTINTFLDGKKPD